jgi:hypothetical protein
MLRYLSAVSLAVMFVGVTAIGQTAISYGPSVGIDTAKKVASVAVGEAQRNHWYMAVAVVDTSGTLIYYEKMDNTQTGSATDSGYVMNFVGSGLPKLVCAVVTKCSATRFPISCGDFPAGHFLNSFG